jgi:hypothetical protein
VAQKQARPATGLPPALAALALPTVQLLPAVGVPQRSTFERMNYLLLAWACRAQAAAPTTYEFLTLLESESQASGLAKIVFEPAFQGKTEVPLERLLINITSNK